MSGFERPQIRLKKSLSFWNILGTLFYKRLKIENGENDFSRDSEITEEEWEKVDKKAIERKGMDQRRIDKRTKLKGEKQMEWSNKYVD